MVSRDPIEIKPACRYSVVAVEGGSVRERLSSDALVTHTLPANTVVVVAEVANDRSGVQRARIGSPAGWIDVAQLGEAPAVTSVRYDAETFKQNHLTVAPGDLYGLDFPFTIEMVEQHGAEFLTKAFRATGILAADNRVVSLEHVEPCFLGQASDKAFVEVVYARSEPGLSTKLFVKVPSSDPQRKFYLASTVPFEVEFARLSSKGVVPVRVPRFYFGDYCSKTSNFILITERIAFGEGDIAPACDKALDHELADARDRYLVLTRSLASLAAAQKRGALGYGIESVFPFTAKASRSLVTVDPVEKLDKLIAFIEDFAPKLFPDWATRGDFLSTWREDVLFGLAHGGTLARQLHVDVDYVGICHPNLNLDNAWFWREADGALQAGLLDWGMTRQMSVGQALLGMLMFPEPEIYRDLVRDVVREFVAEFALGSGQKLDEETLHAQLKVSLFLTTIPMILSIVVDQFDQFSKEEYRSMESRFDPRLMESGLAAGVIWVRNVLEEWYDDRTPGDACREMMAEAAR